MKEFAIYWNDLTPNCQERLKEFLGGDNGNYDVFPITVINGPDVVRVEFVSVWDNGITVSTQAMYDPETGLVFNVEEASEINTDALDVCEREYVIINGEDRDIEDNADGTYTVIE